MRSLKRMLYFTGILLILFSSKIILAHTETSVTEYQPFFAMGTIEGDDIKIAIRSFKYRQELRYLIVDPSNLKTQIVAANTFRINEQIKIAQNSLMQLPLNDRLINSTYIQGLKRYTSAPYPLQNDGLTHATSTQPSSQSNIKDVFLTIDMCPSKKLFEKEFFQLLVNQSNENQHAVPIAIAVSGVWIARHQDEFQWLIQQQQIGKFDITWINHSFSHFYDNKLPLKSNFLLASNQDIEYEIFETEKLLIERGQTPSIFFRFPGLISNEKAILLLRNLGLIPVGSNAWLAKNQKIHQGSIILVHGNSNEPKGIKFANNLLAQNKIKLLPLAQAVNLH